MVRHTFEYTSRYMLNALYRAEALDIRIRSKSGHQLVRLLGLPVTHPTDFYSTVRSFLVKRLCQHYSSTLRWLVDATIQLEV